MEIPQFIKMLCLFFVAGSLCKNLVHPAKLARWIVHVRGQLVLVIVEISVEHQHPETRPIQQIFCVISTYAKKKKKSENLKHNWTCILQKNESQNITAGSIDLF